MRIQVSHETVYRYSQPARGVIQTLRLTPRNHESQYVIDWRIDVSENCQVDQHEDAFGNITHVFNVDGPLTELRILAEGEIDTQDANGVVRGGIERFPASLYLRETPLTQADQAIAEFAAEARKVGGDSVLSVLHALLERVHEGIEYDDRSSTTSTTTAAEAFALKRGICQDFTHVFISAARSLAIPARYIGGHFFRADGAVVQEAAHAWAEAFVPDLGWVAFDAANGLCATDAHVRVAVGLDYLGAAPTRGARYGGGEEALDVTVRVSCPFDASQGQSQSQS